jgi:MFS family permease
MAYLDRQIISLLLPSLKADLGVSDTQASLIQGMAFASVYAFAGLPMGWIADHTIGGTCWSRPWCSGAWPRWPPVSPTTSGN